MFEKFIERYEKTLVNDVIPFWEKNCVDKEFGGYFTSLDRDGSVYDTNKYMWMQWRIVYMFGEFYAAQNRTLVFVPDHGGHLVEENTGIHGFDIPEDMLVSHYYRLKAKQI